MTLGKLPGSKRAPAVLASVRVTWLHANSDWLTHSKAACLWLRHCANYLHIESQNVLVGWWRAHLDLILIASGSLAQVLSRTALLRKGCPCD